MNHLDFILWLLLTPIAVTVCDYFGAKKRAITGEKKKEWPDRVNEEFAWICFGVYVVIALILY